jgi:hypothetical protein
MRPALTVHLLGKLSQTGLDEFRRRLDLHRSGRLTDEQDEDFGYRYLREDKGHFIRLTLWRKDADGTRWVVELTYQNEPPDEATVDRLLAQIQDAAAAAGLSLEGSRRHPKRT